MASVTQSAVHNHNAFLDIYKMITSDNADIREIYDNNNNLIIIIYLIESVSLSLI